MSGKSLYIISLVLLSVSLSAAVMADTQYPIPITNNIERTSDTSLKVLAYPKYYKAADGKLAKVETSLVPSPDPAWDFEVTKGIWTLKIRKDGLFQAIHDSDIFAYRFQSLGLGRGSHYAAFNFGDIDWSNYSVSGNAITWHDVYPQIDVTVRYFHDILKVDVLIEKELVKKIETFVGEKKWNPSTFLTARFDIVQLYLTSEPTLGGETVDLYTENLEAANRQVKFMRNGEVLHKLRPVDAYTIDEKGERIVFRSDGKTPNKMVRMRTAQVWQLRQNQPGIAELSVSMEDVINAPEGDLVIDPTKDFGGGYFTDTVLNEISGENNFESSSYLELGNYYEEKRILIGVDIGDGDEWDDGFYNVEKAEIKLYIYNTYNVSGDHDAVFYKMTEDWDPSDVCWDDDGEGTNWDGGDYTTSVRGEYTTLPTSASWVSFDITDVYKSLFYASPGDVLNPGMILVGYNLPTYPAPLWSFYSADYTSYRPELELTYPSAERLSIDGLTQPYSDTFAYPIPFQGKWYITMNSEIEDPDDNVKHCAVGLLLMDKSTTDGLAEATIANINNKLLRITPTNYETPYPGAGGTPYVAFQAPYVQFSPIPTQTTYPPDDEWYGRMAAISSAYVECNGSPTPSPRKIHAFFHAEDNHGDDGESYGWTYNAEGTPIAHVNYSRIGYAVSADGLSYSQVNASASNANEPGPLIRSYMSEAAWVNPPLGYTPTPGGPTPTPYLEHGSGVRHPWVIERDNYLYLFYDKMDTARWVAAVQPTPSMPNILDKCIRRKDGAYDLTQTLCVARSSITDLQDYDQNQGDANPWYNYYDDGIGDEFNENANGGWSSYIINKQLECPSVTENKYLNEYTLLCGGYLSGEGKSVLYLYICENSTFTSWSEGLRIDVSSSENEAPYYGYFVNTESEYGDIGSVVQCGQNPFLYYLPGLSGSRKTSRISFVFID